MHIRGEMMINDSLRLKPIKVGDFLLKEKDALQVGNYALIMLVAECTESLDFGKENLDKSCCCPIKIYMGFRVNILFAINSTKIKKLFLELEIFR